MMKAFNLTMILVLIFNLFSMVSATAQDKTQGQIIYKQKVNIHASLSKEQAAMKAMIPEFLESEVLVLFKDKKSKITAKESNSSSGDVQISISNGGSADAYIDFEKNLYYRTISLEGDQFHTQMSIAKANTKPLKFTKKICGYNCKSANFILDDEMYAIYYTTELEGNFSPMPGVFAEGVILAIVSKKLTYIATEVSFKEIDNQAVTIPESSEKITEEQFLDLQEEQVELSRP